MDSTLTQIIQDLVDAHAEKGRLEHENAFLRGQISNLTKPKTEVVEAPAAPVGDSA